jgi:hypothetical protein
MITAKQAEVLAQEAMQDYVNKCGCDNEQDVANALMKLASMCGLGMCAVVGQAEAVSRLQGTTDYIANAQAGQNWKKETVQ